jgi:Rieske Fe-S protein
MTADDRAPDAAASCPGCTTRREFLGAAATAAAAAAALLGLGLGADRLAALPVTLGDAASANGELRTYPIPAADGVTIDKKAQVILVRYQQAIYAFALSCPHENAALRWRDGDKRFQCPRHESKYSPDGQFLSGRATRNMDRFGIVRQENSVVVDLAKYYRSDQNNDEWAAAVVKL